MLDSLRSNFWSGPKAPRLEAWSLDRNRDRTEGERLLKARSYAEAETYLQRAAVDAEKRGHSAPKRIQVRLLLAEAQRKQLHVIQAKDTVPAAIEIAARTGDHVAYLQCLDALADIFAEQSNFVAVEKITRDALKIESSQPHPDPLRMARRVHRLGMARHHSGRIDEAIPMLEKVVVLHEESFGKDHLENGNQLTALGAAYRAHGNREEAQKCLRRALKIHETACDRQSAEAIKGFASSGWVARRVRRSGGRGGAIRAGAAVPASRDRQRYG